MNYRQPRAPGGYCRLLPGTSNSAVSARAATPPRALLHVIAKTGAGNAVAVLVEFPLKAATRGGVERAEAMAMQRGQQVGGLIYDGCIFVAVAPEVDDMRFTSAWRPEVELHGTFETALGPDLAVAGLVASDLVITRIASMAVPGAHEM